jgi:hypothetical protein
VLPDPRPYFAELADPRRATKNKLHPLQDILMIVFCAVLSGVEDWVGMETFAREKEAWFRRFLELPNGIPSHDTLGDVMGRLASGVFADVFLRWARSALPSLAGEQVCLDGKTLRGSRGADGAVHLLGAYAAKARLVLALTKRWTASPTKSPPSRRCWACWICTARSSASTPWAARRPSPKRPPKAARTTCWR